MKILTQSFVKTKIYSVSSEFLACYTRLDKMTFSSLKLRSIKQLDKINSTYLPRPDEKLFLLPDTASEDLCSGWALYTERIESGGRKLLPVQYCSAKL